MKQIVINLSILFVVWIFPAVLSGQETIKVDEIKVIKDFEARLKDFTKVDLIPALPGFDLSTRSYQYTISGRPVKLDYDKPSIRPLALPPIKEPVSKKASVKAAYGMPNAILADLSYVFKKGSMLSGVSFSHLSADNKNIENQQFSNNKLAMNLQNSLAGGSAYKVYADFNIDYYNLFAVESYADPNHSFTDPKRRYTHWNTRFKIPSMPLSSKLEIQAEATYKFVHANIESAYEHNLSLEAMPEIEVGADFSILLPVETGTALSNAHGARGFISFSPLMVYGKPFFTLELGLNAGHANDYFVYPVAKVSLNKIFTFFDIFGGVNQNIFLNSTYSLIQENPFLHFASNTSNTRVSRNYFAGARANIEGALFEFVAAYHQIDNLPLYAVSTVDERQFDVIYDNASDLSLQAELDYKINDQFAVTARLVRHFFTMENQVEAWHKPNFETFANTRVNFLDKKLILEGGLIFKSGIHFQNPQSGISETLPVIFDLNSQLRYNLWKDIEVFMLWNNMTASRYNRWYQYPSYRTVIMGGVKLLI